MSANGLHIVRPIIPSDLPAVARIHLLAFPDSALTSLGMEAVRRYYHWQLTGPHDVVALSIVESGEVTAFCFGGRFRGALEGFLRTNRRYLFWLVATRPWVLANEIVRERIGLALKSLGRRRLQSSTEPIIENSKRANATFGILSIAVHPNKVGTGQGKYLIDCMEKAAQERNFGGMHLTVSPNNRRAMGFYERLGWSRDSNNAGTWTGAMSKKFL